MSMSPLDQCLVWWITAKKSRRLCAHLCSWAAMCTESMIRRRASEICLALIVCCSNLVFTADWEMHSCKHTHIYDSQTNTQTHTFKPITLPKPNNTHLKTSFKVLKLKHSCLKTFSQSTTWKSNKNGFTGVMSWKRGLFLLFQDIYIKNFKIKTFKIKYLHKKYFIL